MKNKPYIGKIYILDCSKHTAVKMQYGLGHMTENEWIKSQDIKVDGINKVILKSYSLRHDGNWDVIVWSASGVRFTGGGIFSCLEEYCGINYNDYWAKLNET